MISMRKQRRLTWVGLSICFLFSQRFWLLQAEEPSLPNAIENTVPAIEDIHGKVQHPFQCEHAKASVLFFVTHDCPISNAYSPELSRLRNEYEAKGFEMMLVYVDPEASAEEIKVHMKEYSLSAYTAIVDQKHRLVNASGATVTPEVAVILPDGAISYRGRIDNLFPELGQRRRVTTEKDLRNALNAIIENKPVEVSRTQAVGCYVPNL